MSRMLVVTAVEAERDAVCRYLGAETGGVRGDLVGLTPVSIAQTPGGEVVVTAGGVGPASAAATTALLAATAAAESSPFDLLVCAGIGGGFSIDPGELVCATAALFGDLGAETDAPDGFTSAPELGFGVDNYPTAATISAEFAQRCGAVLGPILTITTVTGTAATASFRRRHHPGVLAEGMEGAGVAAAAAATGSLFTEIRAISNHVGPRNRDAWQIPRALDALADAFAAITAAPW